MKINELILEQKQLDELNLAGVGKGIGDIARGAGAAVQGIKGAWDGAKDAYAQGKGAGYYDKARDVVRGNSPRIDPNAPADNTSAPVAGTTSGGAAGAFSQQPAPQGNTAPAPSAPQAAAPAGGAAGQFSQQPAAPAQQGRVGVPAGKKAVDQAVTTVQSVRSDRRPQVIQYAKQKVDALAQQAAKPAPADDNPNIVKGTNESKIIGFRSNFLGMDI